MAVRREADRQKKTTMEAFDKMKSTGKMNPLVLKKMGLAPSESIKELPEENYGDKSNRRAV